MAARAMRPEDWVWVRPEGLYVEPGNFFVDPGRVVETAIITHGHSDHARAGNGRVAATQATLDIMTQRMNRRPWRECQALAYGERLQIGDVTVWLAPAGHVLGSAQVIVEYAGQRVVISGDYKRQIDPTCAAFELVPCDVFVTEATFGLPVFQHPDPGFEVTRLLHSREIYPDRPVVVHAYSLGKAQRMLALLRAADYQRPIYVAPTILGVCEIYRKHGIDLGDLQSLDQLENNPGSEIILAPPSKPGEGIVGKLRDPLIVMASGWMTVRKHARGRGAELPLVISDHADWNELVGTIQDLTPDEVWVTHGREDALIHQTQRLGIKARALSAIGNEAGAEQ